MLWGDKIHSWNFYYALFSLIKLGFGPVMCTVLVSLCHRRVEDILAVLQLRKIPVDANVIDKQPKSVESATSRGADDGVFKAPPEQLFLPEGFRLSDSSEGEEIKCVLFYLLLQRLKNFALISVSDRDFMRVTRGDRQWFGKQSPSSILHKEPNMLCPRSGTLFRSGCSDVNCLNKSWEEPLTCLQTSHNYVRGRYLPWEPVIGPACRSQGGEKQKK